MADDVDLRQLRAFRISESTPTDDALERIQRDVMVAIVEEEQRGHVAPAAKRPGRRALQHASTRPWWSAASLLRPAIAATAMASLALGIAVVSDGGSTRAPGPQTGSSVRQAGSGVLDSAARELFGVQAAATTPGDTVLAGDVNLSEPSRDQTAALVQGPALTDSGELDDASTEIARSAARSPEALLEQVRVAVIERDGDDHAHRRIFNAAMRWVVEPAVPVDLRVAMLRAVEGLPEIAQARIDTDLTGRQGVVIAHVDSSIGIRDEYVLALESGRLLEQRSYTAAYLDPACPPVTFTSYELRDEDGMRVEPEEAPYLNWPSIVDACDPAADAG